jgi:glycosyltransferase involved in cell wall biosynthesis
LKKLVVISHTEHQLNKDGIIVGWAPTVNEINFLAGYFDEVVHVACLENSEAKGSSVPYTAQNVKFQSIPAFGGKTWLDKLGIVLKAPQILIKVQKSLKNATHVQLRLPTSIGLFLLPYFSFLNKKRYVFWVKYANNWVQPNPPLSYWFQRWFLVSNLAGCKVTINGSWLGQPKHCLTFENPCLNEADRKAGWSAIEKKILLPPFKLVFVGRVEEKKGIFILLEALQSFKSELIHSLTIIGSGEGDTLAIELSRRLTIPVYILGDVPQFVVHNILENAHFLVLPSYSEGFPKVAAEAMNYGCIPILSKVGSIPYYLEDGLNSFLLEKIDVNSLLEVLQRVYATDQNKLRFIQKIGYETSNLFTFKKYLSKLESTIFEVEKVMI